MEVLSGWTELLPLGEFVERTSAGTLPPHAVALTFDDGYADNLHTVLPVLERSGAPATVFVTSCFVGPADELWWDALERIFLAPGSLPVRLCADCGHDVVEIDLGAERTLARDQAGAYPTWRAWSGDPLTALHRACVELWQRLVKLAPSDIESHVQKLRAWSGVESTAIESHRGLGRGELALLAQSGPHLECRHWIGRWKPPGCIRQRSGTFRMYYGPCYISGDFSRPICVARGSSMSGAPRITP